MATPPEEREKQNSEELIVPFELRSAVLEWTASEEKKNFMRASPWPVTSGVLKHESIVKFFFFFLSLFLLSHLTSFIHRNGVQKGSAMRVFTRISVHHR
jgi:hypothetical protein